MRRLRRRKTRHEPKMQEISLTPLIDTALTLLIIFMLTAPMLHTSLKVNLPSTEYDQSSTEKEEVVVHLDQQGRLSINDTLCQLDQFEDHLKRFVTEKDPHTIFVHADEGVQYGHVIRVVDQIKMLDGVQYVALASKQG